VEGGGGWGRGKTPLSAELPSPAINAFNISPTSLAGEGIKG
jgi:hypothetical protein